MKKLFAILGTTGSVLTFLVVLPALVAAQPGSTPPTGVVNADFNSVNVADTLVVGGQADVGGDINGDSDINANAELNAVSFVNSSTGFRLAGASATFAIDQVGSLTRFYDSTTQPLNFFDANGVTFAGPIWTGPTFSDAKPIVISDPDGFRVTTYGGTQGLEIAATGDISDSNSAVTLNDSQGVSVPQGDMTISGAGRGLYVTGSGGGIVTPNINVDASLFDGAAGVDGDTNVDVLNGLEVNGQLQIDGSGELADLSGNVTINDAFEVTGHVDLTATTDASGTVNTGVLEIGDNLRIDTNEIVTTTGAALYLNYDNGGGIYLGGASGNDINADAGTLFVDSSANRVGIGDTTPATALQVNGQIIAGEIGQYYMVYTSATVDPDADFSGQTYTTYSSPAMGTTPNASFSYSLGGGYSQWGISMSCIAGDVALNASSTGGYSDGPESSSILQIRDLDSISQYYLEPGWVAPANRSVGFYDFYPTILCFSPNG